MNIPGPPRMPSFGNNDFDKNFAKMQKRSSSLFSLAIGIWAVWACIVLGVVGTAIYVAVHFLSKVW